MKIFWRVLAIIFVGVLFFFIFNPKLWDNYERFLSNSCFKVSLDDIFNHNLKSAIAQQDLSKMPFMGKLYTKFKGVLIYYIQTNGNIAYISTRSILLQKPREDVDYDQMMQEYQKSLTAMPWIPLLTNKEIPRSKSSYSLNNRFSKGSMEYNDVEAINKELGAKHIDGLFDKQTESKLMEWKKSYNEAHQLKEGQEGYLTPDGLWGEKESLAMKAKYEPPRPHRPTYTDNVLYCRIPNVIDMTKWLEDEDTSQILAQDQLVTVYGYYTNDHGDITLERLMVEAAFQEFLLSDKNKKASLGTETLLNNIIKNNQAQPLKIPENKYKSYQIAEISDQQSGETLSITGKIKSLKLDDDGLLKQFVISEGESKLTCINPIGGDEIDEIAIGDYLKLAQGQDKEITLIISITSVARPANIIYAQIYNRVFKIAA